MALHETDLAYNRSYLRFVNHIDILGLDDADVLALTTVTGLVTAIGNETAMHETDTNIRRHSQSAVAAAGVVGVITDQNVADANTVAGLKSVATTNDSSLSASEDTSFAYQPMGY